MTQQISIPKDYFNPNVRYWPKADMAFASDAWDAAVVIDQVTLAFPWPLFP
jgi:hypothetical protein